MKPLTKVLTAGEVIDILGGEDVVGEMVGAAYKAVNNWRNFNSFPAVTYGRLLFELCQKGYTAPPSLWKQVGCDGLNLWRISVRK